MDLIHFYDTSFRNGIESMYILMYVRALLFLLRLPYLFQSVHLTREAAQIQLPFSITQLNSTRHNKNISQT